jgi:hypothetical protein
MNDEIKPNPKHSELLNLIPGELHALIVPVLKKWDQNVNDQFANIHSQYEEFKPFKALIDANVDPSFAQQAVALVNHMQENPAEVLKQINDNWDLGYLSKEEASQIQAASTEEDEFMLDSDQLLNDPRFKALADKVQSFEGQLTKRQQDEALAAEIEAFEDSLDELEEDCKGKNLPFNREFVTALVSNGLSGEDAVKQFHQVLINQGLKVEAQPDSTQDEVVPPVVLGGGSAGSGMPDGTVKFGSLSKNDLNASIEQMLQQAAQSGQG